MKRTALLALLFAFAACQTTTTPVVQSAAGDGGAALGPVAPDVAERTKQLPRTVIDYDRALLNENERRVVAKLIEASKQIDEIYWRQVAEENPAWREQLAKQGGAAYDYFIANKGPW